MLKPYLVEMRIAAVVMAKDEADAKLLSEDEARRIVSEGNLQAHSATLVNSLVHLKTLPGDWDGLCIPYGGDGNTRLRELLPEVAT